MSDSPAYTPELLEKLKALVRAVGADWCGVQETIDPHQSLLLFNSRKTHSTLAAKFDPVDFDSAEAASLRVIASDKLRLSDAAFNDRKILVKESTLERIAKTASEIVAEVEELRRRK